MQLPSNPVVILARPLTLLCNGNLLLEGLPGLAKTRAVKALAGNLEADCRRIQFTPDLLPSDLTGTEVYYSEGGTGKFKFDPGPIFANLVFADEINRAPAKVQAALLEAMGFLPYTPHIDSPFSGQLLHRSTPPAVDRFGDSEKP